VTRPPIDGPAPLGIFARTFTGAAPLEVLQQARDAGFALVQYNMACSGLPSLPHTVPRADVDAIRAAMHATGVGIAALSATYNMIHPDPVARRTGHDGLVALAGVAEALRIPMLTLCTGSRNREDQWSAHPDNGLDPAWSDLRVSMNAALEVAERHGVMLGMEPEPSNVVGSGEAARRLIDELGHARLGVVLDTANLVDPAVHRTAAARRDVFARAVDQLADRILLVHAKDRASDGGVVAPGHGIVDFDACFRALAGAGVCVPVITHGLEPHDAAAAATYLSERIVAQGAQ
jgi:sugar phosphate isomerase/epimerase